MIEYILQRKNVKNINLRIKPDGKVYVSANPFVSKRVIDNFVSSKQDFIMSALEEYREKRKMTAIKYCTEDELKVLIVRLCEKIYPYFEKRGAVKKFPEIKFKKLKSKWGSLHISKGVLTFNTQLVYAPYECVVYVVLHEFTHFIQANHSRNFYCELEKICPEWKKLRQKLKETSV